MRQQRVDRQDEERPRPEVQMTEGHVQGKREDGSQSAHDEDRPPIRRPTPVCQPCQDDKSDDRDQRGERQKAGEIGAEGGGREPSVERTHDALIHVRLFLS